MLSRTPSSTSSYTFELLYLVCKKEESDLCCEEVDCGIKCLSVGLAHDFIGIPSLTEESLAQVKEPALLISVNSKGSILPSTNFPVRTKGSTS